MSRQNDAVDFLPSWVLRDRVRTKRPRPKVQPKPGESYFLRYVEADRFAESDVRRGYSFHGYEWFHTPEQARAFARTIGQSIDQVVSFTIEGQGRKYGVRQKGLSAFGPFHSIEEADAAADKHRGYSGMYWPRAAIITGRLIEKGHDKGEVIIRPGRIVKFRGVHF